MLQINNEYIDYCHNECLKVDKEWIKRKRKITTRDIFDTLATSASTNSGISTNVKMMGNYSHVGMLKARDRVPIHTFKKLNDRVHEEVLRKNHIYAIDGSKVRMLKGKEKYGYTSRTNNVAVSRPAKKPICMLSALTGIQTDTIVNYTVTKHFNERQCVYDLVKPLQKDDIVLFDRGYYSKELYSFLNNSKLKCVMRIKKTANRDVKKFYSSTKSQLVTFLIQDEKIIKVKYIKKKIGDTTFVMCTNIFDATPEKIMNLYKMRWRVELSFKRLKSHLYINKIKALSEKLWLQEFESRILLDTLARFKQVSMNSSIKNKTLYTCIIKSLFLSILIKNIGLNLKYYSIYGGKNTAQRCNKYNNLPV